MLRTYVETIRAVYDGEDTALLTELGNPRSYPWLRHAMYYLPEYPIYQLYLRAEPPRVLRAAVGGDHDPDAGDHHHGAAAGCASSSGSWTTGIRTMPRPRGLLEIQLAYGRFLYVLPLGRRPVEHAGYTFVRDEAE